MDNDMALRGWVREHKVAWELPWIATMWKHCESYMREAERLAEADRFAEFHPMRAEEMAGK